MMVIYTLIGVLFTIAALLAVVRIVRGPSILDRVIASDVLLTTLILVVGAEMVYNGHTRSIAMMVVLAATAIFATVAVARYVSKQDLTTATARADGGTGANDAANDDLTVDDSSADDNLGDDLLADDETIDDTIRTVRSDRHDDT